MVAHDDPRHGELYDLLLSHGGVAVTARHEEDIGKLLGRGYARSGRGVKLAKGAPSQCHRNTALLWDANRSRSTIVTGWALSDDGIWRQHSWVKDMEADRLYETTEKRTLYFGFDLTPEEAEDFYQNNAF